MRGLKPREIASQVLGEHLRPDGLVEERLDTALARAALPEVDRRLTRELVLGTLRWLAPLDWLIARKRTGRPAPAPIEWLLRLGLYQLFWLDRIPDHAAVHATVELVKRRGFAAQAGFVNALLRAYTREREETLRRLEALKQENPSLGYAHPAWLCERWEARWGREGLLRLLAWNNTPAPTYARLNTLRVDPDRLAARWQTEGVTAITKAWDWTPPFTLFALESFPPLDQLESLRLGWFYVQDPSTLLAVRLLDPQPGDTLLDACAAPGGKTTCLAQRLHNRGRIVALEPHPGRRRLLAENCRRLGAQCVEIFDPNSDAAQKHAVPQFDRILLDVPCSNTGVMRRRLELRWRAQPAELPRLVEIQQEILHRHARFLKPGGVLVYSTCSLEPEENEDLIRAFLADHPEFQLAAQRQVLPFEQGVDGAYVARLRRLPRPPS